MENERNETAQLANLSSTVPDLSNDPFLVKKDQIMMEILCRCPVPKNLLNRAKGVKK